MYIIGKNYLRHKVTNLYCCQMIGHHIMVHVSPYAATYKLQGEKKKGKKIIYKFEKKFLFV